MIIVTDPCNVSTREIIKVSRALICAAQALLEMVLWKLLKPPPQRVKRPLIDKAVGKTHDDRAKVDEIDKSRRNEASSAKVDEIDKDRSNEASSAKVDEVDNTNAEIVESKDDKSDTVAKGAGSQDDNVAKRTRRGFLSQDRCSRRVRKRRSSPGMRS